jgi:Na+/proline symporter|tara:strand:+ start:49 stop:1494 length:1446 start_codon:yes stop_codon:yes gene_type:complete
MKPEYILLLMVGYFCLLLIVARISTKKTDNSTFFLGNRQSPWWLVSFGMIGASLSGVTFISVPGWVETSGMAYLQMVLGYVVGYFCIAFLLLPIYYKHNTTTIYGFLAQRYGKVAHTTGATFFIISRWLGASFRLYLVASVLQSLVFDELGVSFIWTVLITLALIWVYTNRGGIRTVIFTDTLQTIAMLGAMCLTIYYVYNSLDNSNGIINTIFSQDESKWFFPDATDGRNFWKQFLGGIFITLAMTGLDQDMMQKNLTCRNLKEAQLNMITLSGVLVFVNALFLSLGVLLLIYARQEGIEAHGDQLFPAVASYAEIPIIVGLLFFIGLIAAAYSSADSALTSLTTSFCVDILGIEKMKESRGLLIRKRVHVGMTLAIALLIIAARPFVDASIIKNIFTAAGYTYGPLLGLFTFGIFSKAKIPNKWIIPFAAILSPLLTYFIGWISPMYFNYTFGFEIIILNGLLMTMMLYFSSSSVKNIS